MMVLANRYRVSARRSPFGLLSLMPKTPGVPTAEKYVGVFQAWDLPGGGSRPPHAPGSQSKSLVLKPHMTHPLSSVLATLNCAKMAHFRPRNG
jgi:hypothetical protein